MFSDAVLAQPLIKEKFNEALDIMNRAVSSGMGRYHTHTLKTYGLNLCGQHAEYLTCDLFPLSPV